MQTSEVYDDCFTLALLANLRVEIVSSMASNAGEIMAIIVVLQFPPNESCFEIWEHQWWVNNWFSISTPNPPCRTSSILVSLLSLYGICCLFLASVRADMTLPSAESDRLICLLSSKRCPVAPDRRTRSEPAKSTKFNLPTYSIPAELTTTDILIKLPSDIGIHLFIHTVYTHNN